MIDLKDFIELEPSVRTVPYRVTVHEDGRIMLNSRLNRELTEREASLHLSRDGNIFVIDPSGSKFRFNKNGRVKNDKIAGLLKRKTFPVNYIMEWSDEQRIWIGKTERVGKCPPEK